MQELDAKLKQLPAWELAPYPVELEAGGSPESLAPPEDSKPQKEDRRDIDEDGGHLYDRIKMLYEEGYEPEPVLTQRREDAISIISNLSPPCLKHEFSYPQQSHLITNVTFLWDSSLFWMWRTSSSRIRNWCRHRRRKFKSWWLFAPVYLLLLRRPLSSVPWEVLLLMLPS